MTAIESKKMYAANPWRPTLEELRRIDEENKDFLDSTDA